jgi:hypothetical protein
MWVLVQLLGGDRRRRFRDIPFLAHVRFVASFPDQLYQINVFLPQRVNAVLLHLLKEQLLLPFRQIGRQLSLCKCHCNPFNSLTLLL